MAKRKVKVKVVKSKAVCLPVDVHFKTRRGRVVDFSARKGADCQPMASTLAHRRAFAKAWKGPGKVCLKKMWKGKVVKSARRRFLRKCMKAEK